MAIPEVLTLEEASAALRVTPDILKDEFENGRAPGFRVGPYWRMTHDALIVFMTAPATSPHAGDAAAASAVVWQSAPRFDYHWPKQPTAEHYDSALETTLAFPSGKFRFVIGVGVRECAGMDRRRAVVFLKDGGRLLPLVEFAGANDFDTTKRLVSVIKTADGQHVSSASELPPEYTGIPTAIYNDVIQGRFAA